MRRNVEAILDGGVVAGPLGVAGARGGARVADHRESRRRRHRVIAADLIQNKRVLAPDGERAEVRMADPGVSHGVEELPARLESLLALWYWISVVLFSISDFGPLASSSE
jgi:hypothetical protein